MDKRRYEQVVHYFKTDKTANTWLKIIYRWLPMLLFAAYPLLLVCAFFAMPHKLLRLTLVPLGVLIFVTVLRILINEQRPYERYQIASVFDKQTKGKSMPSRHTACAFIIAMSFLSVSIPIGSILLAIALLIALSRVLAGAHYLRDVIAGGLISVTAGILFFFIF